MKKIFLSLISILLASAVLLCGACGKTKTPGEDENASLETDFSTAAVMYFNAAADAVFASVDPSAVTPDTVYLSAGTSESNKQTLGETANNLIFALAQFKNAFTMQEGTDALNSLAVVFSDLCGAGADTAALLEAVAEKLTDHGFVYEAGLLAHSYDGDFSAEQQFADVTGDVFASAGKVLSEGATKEAAIAEARELTGKTDEKTAGYFARILYTAALGLKYRDDRNFTVAALYLSGSADMLSVTGIIADELALEAICAYMLCGDIPSAQQGYNLYFAEGAAIPDDYQLRIQSLTEICAALDKTAEVFSPFYQEWYYDGKDFDYEGAVKALDAMPGKDSDKYTAGMISVCKYYAAYYSGNTEFCGGYLQSITENLGDIPMYFASADVDFLIGMGRYGEAYSAAENYLAFDCGNDFLYSALARLDRMNGDTAKSLETALAGMEKSQTVNYSALEAAICYLLDGKFDVLCELLEKLSVSVQSYDVFDIILIAEAKYDGDDEALKSRFNYLGNYVRDAYAEYQTESFDDTKAILAGEKSLEDVFTKGACELA